MATGSERSEQSGSMTIASVADRVRYFDMTTETHALAMGRNDMATEAGHSLKLKGEVPIGRMHEDGASETSKAAMAITVTRAAEAAYFQEQRFRCTHISISKLVPLPTLADMEGHCTDGEQ